MELAQPILAERPDEVAIADELGSWTWLQTNERVNRLVHGLRSLGLQVGDAIACLSGNRHEFLEVNAACSHAGLVFVPVNWHLVADEVAYILSDSGAKAVATEAEFLDVATKAADAAGVELRILFEGAKADGYIDYEELLASSSPDEPDDQSGGASMFYTSGTTGQPKGVRSSALRPGQPLENLIASIQGLGSLLGIRPNAKTLVNSPLYHAGPYAAAVLASATGGAIVLRKKFDPVESLRLIQDDEIAQAYFVPTHFVRFLKLDDETKNQFDLSPLENVWHTGAPVSPDVKRQIIDWWGPVLSEYYGASEGFGSGTFVSSEEWLRKPGTVGKPLPTCQVLILGEDGEELPTGQVGQVWFKSLIGVDFEYSGAPEKTKSVHKEPGVYTYGDVGYLDEDGYLFLSDRKIDMIVSGGVNIYPAEIESVLINHPAIADVAAFGVPNEEFGEEVKVAVQLAEGAERSVDLEADLKKFAKEKLAGYKNPRSWDFVEEFPRTPTGKLQKRLLRDPYWEGKERAI
ncbi:MAG TPA: AMP-binding protein [Actinomycetota bacterium]|nr:AMP-binding protein [Actinomycetota bacterium]